MNNPSFCSVHTPEFFACCASNSRSWNDLYTCAWATTLTIGVAPEITTLNIFSIDRQFDEKRAQLTSYVLAKPLSVTAHISPTQHGWEITCSFQWYVASIYRVLVQYVYHILHAHSPYRTPHTYVGEGGGPTSARMNVGGGLQGALRIIRLEASHINTIC